MRIAIYGAGSLGTILGAYLSKDNLPVDLITRDRKHVEALNKDGAKVVGTVNMTVPVHALTPDEMEGEYDIIFLMTKQLDNRSTLEFLLPHLAKDGILCTMQNGMPETLVSEIVGEERTMGCAVAWGATKLGPGVSELTSEKESMSFALGRPNGTIDDKVLLVKEVLEHMCPVTIEKNFLGSRMSKLLINSAFSGMSAVCGKTFGEVAKDKRSRKVIQNIIKEGIDVSKKSGIQIEPIQGKDIVKLLDYHSALKKKFSFLIIPIAIKKHRLLKASMLQDIEQGKKTEIDSINGVICAMGRKVSVPTPCNDMVVKIIHEIEEGKRKPSMDNVALFRAK